MKKKYTIIYSVEVGSTIGTRFCIPTLEHVETDNLAELIRQEKYDCMTHFIFDGWIESTKD
jgi:hypothetical protein